MQGRMFAICSLAIASVSIDAAAQVSVVENALYYSAEPATGHAYREDVGKATQALLRGDVDTGTKLLRGALAYCDAQRAQPGRKALSFSSRREYEQYMEGPGRGQPTEWLDIACASAYQQTGYALAGARRSTEALAYLDIAIEVGPYYPSGHNERGFVLNQLGRPKEALASYSRALELADQHPEEAYIKPIALRGTGYSKVELGDLAGARAAYQASLALEPGNKTALSELDYISAQLDQKASADTASVTPQNDEATPAP